MTLKVVANLSLVRITSISRIEIPIQKTIIYMEHHQMFRQMSTLFLNICTFCSFMTKLGSESEKFGLHVSENVVLLQKLRLF